MKRVLAAALTLVGLVFAVGCVGAPESDGAGGNGAADEPALQAQADHCTTPIKKCPIDSHNVCEFYNDCSGSCHCVRDK
jgi:hypothetical protein